MNPFFAASGTQTLITLVVFVAISLISTWLKKRQEKEPPGPPPGMPGPRPPQPSSTAASWEAELRRLLEGEEPAPPPVVAEPPRRVPPPVPPAFRPVVIRPVVELDEQEIGLPVRMPELVESSRAHQRASQLEQRVKDFMRPRASLPESTAAYQQAQRLEGKVAEHFKHLTGNVASHTAPGLARTIAPEIVQARAMLHNHQAIRSALIASVVLGPPKALEG